MKIGEGAEIGYNLDEDRKKCHVTESGIVVVEGYQSKVVFLRCRFRAV